MMVHLFKSSLEARDPSIRGLSWFVNHEAMMRNTEWDADRSKYQIPLPPSQAFCQASWAVFWYPSILLCRERHCMIKDWARSPTQTFKGQSIQAASEFYLVTLRVQKYPFIFCGQMKHCENKEIDQMKLMTAVTGTF